MKKIIFIVLTLSIVNIISALAVPKMNARINDYAQVLTSDQKTLLEAMLVDVENKTSSQVALLTITTLENEVLESYSMKVVENWELGQADLDNGVLLLIATKEKKIRIEVGYGLEGIITDLKSGFIIRNIIVPSFQKGNFYEGIAGGLNAISGLITDEFVISDQELQKYQEDAGKKKGGAQIPIGLIIFMIWIFVGLSRRKRLGILPFLFLGSTLRGGSRSSGFGGFGGFSGGGGSFGGGGASGGW